MTFVSISKYRMNIKIEFQVNIKKHTCVAGLDNEYRIIIMISGFLSLFRTTKENRYCCDMIRHVHMYIYTYMYVYVYIHI